MPKQRLKEILAKGGKIPKDLQLRLRQLRLRKLRVTTKAMNQRRAAAAKRAKRVWWWLKIIREQSRTWFRNTHLHWIHVTFSFFKMLLFIKDKTTGHPSHFQQNAVLHLYTHTHLRNEQFHLLLWSSRATEGTVPSLRPHLWLLSKVTLNVFSCFLPCFRLNCSATSTVTSSVLTNTIKETVDP